MDGLKTIGGATVGCFGAAAIGAAVILVAVLGFGWFACHTWDGAKRAIAARGEIEKRLAVTVTKPRFTETGHTVECVVTWENLTNLPITYAAGRVYFKDSSGAYVYTIHIETTGEVPAGKSLTETVRAALVESETTAGDVSGMRGVFHADRLTLDDGTSFTSEL